jgi:hypothetical protein
MIQGFDHFPLFLLAIHDIAEILQKLALNTNQSINQSIAA